MVKHSSWFCSFFNAFQKQTDVVLFYFVINFILGHKIQITSKVCTKNNLLSKTVEVVKILQDFLEIFFKEEL